MGKTYQIVVDGIEGKKRTVDVAESLEDFNNTTVEEFKDKLVKKLPGTTDPATLRLIFGNKQLEDTKKLSDYEIKGGSMVMAVLRLPGGQKDSVWLFTL